MPLSESDSRSLRRCALVHSSGRLVTSSSGVHQAWHARDSCTPRRRRGPDVGLAEILPLEQECGPVAPGAGIGEAVAHVELGRVPASFPEPREGVQRALRLLAGDRDGPDPRSFEEFEDVGLALSHARMELAAEAQRRLEDGDGRRDGRARTFQRVGKRVGFGLAGKDGDDGRRIDEYQGSPLSAS